MTMQPLAYVAMALDTLPDAGRVMLLALLLSCALYGFVRLLPAEFGSGLNVLYRKGALLALCLVPAGVYLFGLQVSVRVEEIVRLHTAAPAYVTYVLLCVWALGAVYCLAGLWRDLRVTRATAARIEPADDTMTQRMRHWQQRLNLSGVVRLACGGAEQAWHLQQLAAASDSCIVLPAAARHWPSGMLDVVLLVQLAHLHQRSWRWLVFGRIVQALYWPTPWVRSMVQQLARHLDRPAHRLAAAAYRDPHGWRRDARQLAQRGGTLDAIADPQPGGLMRLANGGDVWVPPERPPGDLGNGESDFVHKWAATSKRKRAKEQDPYEQAYWLIALACLVVGVATTLTLVKAPPEFEPNYLNIKWQDQMMRRLRDYYADDRTSQQEGTEN